MSEKNNPAAGAVGERLVVTGVVHAPVGMVYRAWTDPKQMAQWWGPEEIECRSVESDLTVGGGFRIHMVSKKGDHIATGRYTRIVPNQRLQFTFQWESYAMPDSVVTVDFEDLGKTTRLRLTHEGLPDKEDAAEHTHGWTSMLEKFGRLIMENKIKE